MPEISRFYGISIYMFYNEHNPPHIHAEYQDYEAVIDSSYMRTSYGRMLVIIFGVIEYPHNTH